MKQALKNAKDAIKGKDFKAALRHCKAAIKVDSDCYIAWVLIGKAAEEIGHFNQSIAAFERACTISPDQATAWQGLYAFYERHTGIGNHENDRYPVYMKVLEFYKDDPAKQVEIADKATNYYRSFKITAKYVDTLEKCARIIGDKPEMYKLWLQLVEFSQDSVDKCAENHLELLEKAYESVVFSTELEDFRRDRFCRSYIDFLVKTGRKDAVTSEVARFGEKFPESTVPFEISCGTYVEKVLSSWEKPEPSAEIDKIDRLIEKQPKLKVGWLAKATHLYASGDVDGTVKALSKAVQSYATREAYILLCWCCLQKRNYLEAENYARKGLIPAERKKEKWPSEKLAVYLAESLCKQQYHEEAAAALEKLGEEHMKRVPVLHCKFEIGLLSGDFDKAQQALNDLKECIGEDPKLDEAQARLLVERGSVDEARSILNKLEVRSAEVVHLLALIHYKLEQFDKAVPLFMEAGYLDPDDYRNFLYLGKHFYYNTENKNNAVKCLQRAFQLNKACAEAGALLSEALSDLGQHEENLQLLETVSKQVPVKRAKWAWEKIGALPDLDKVGISKEAMVALSYALRSDPNDRSIILFLGNAYLKDGCIGNAFDCFSKYLEEGPKDVSVMYKMADIRRRQKNFKEGAELFQAVLDVEPDLFHALKGLAECRRSLAREHFVQGLVGLAKDDCQAAMDAAARALAQDSRVLLVWKAMGDACLLPYMYGLDPTSLKLPASMQEGALQEAGPQQLIRAARKCYMTAVKLKPRLASLWHSLAVAVWLEAALFEGSYADALACARQAVTFAPDNFSYWNSLGVVAACSGPENYGLAQHSFLKSLEIKRKNVDAWTYLGILYLVSDKMQLAHKAFTKAQALQPEVILPWIGQACIAEKIGHQDALWLFWHCVQLGNHVDAARVFGRWVCKVAGTETCKGDMLPNASDALLHIADVAGAVRPEAYNTLGLVLEQRGLFRSARDAFKRALDLRDQLDDNDANCVRVNLARVLCRLNCYEEALQLCDQIEPRSTDLLCVLGHAYGKVGQTAEALKVYQEALSTCQPEEREKIAVAMALVILKASGAAAAKDFLENRSNEASQSCHSLEALCCLAALAQDSAACLTLRQRLMALSKDGPQFVDRTASFFVWQYLMEGDGVVHKECRALCGAILRDPKDGRLWSLLAHALCLAQRSSALKCSLVGLEHGDRSPRHLGTLALAKLIRGRAKEALWLAQKLVFMFPGWQPGRVLLAMTLGEARVQADNAVNDHFLLGADDSLKLWYSLAQVHYACSHRQWHKVSQLVPVILWGFSGSPLVSKMLNVLQAFSDLLANTKVAERASLSSLQEVVDSANTAECWQMLSKLQQMTGDHSAALESLAKAKKFDDSKSKTTTIHLELRQAWLSLCAAKAGSDQREAHLKSALDCLTKALRLNPKCKAGHLILAAWALEKDNPRLAEKSFRRVIKFHSGESSWVLPVAGRWLVQYYLRQKDVAALRELLDAEDMDEQSLSLSKEETEELASLGIDVRKNLLDTDSEADVVEKEEEEKAQFSWSDEEEDGEQEQVKDNNEP